jgi:mannose-6-phosphate isomerase-like protein (cupin superfamily)
MTAFETRSLPPEPDAIAPDGSNVRILLRLAGGSMAHFELPGRRTSVAVAHRTVEEIWFFLGGEGEMWRSQDGREEVVEVRPGVCLTIPVGTHFQFRSLSEGPLTAVAITIPPWPGMNEAYEVEGKWKTTTRSSEMVQFPLPGEGRGS